MDKYPIKLPGGTVTKVDRKWIVEAPDGRNVGEFRRKSDAIAKAQNWDKWDAFDSLHNICLIMSPYTTQLMTKVLISKGEYKPTDDEMKAAVAADIIIMIFRNIARENK